jgi:hypothetical protein
LIFLHFLACVCPESACSWETDLRKCSKINDNCASKAGHASHYYGTVKLPGQPPRRRRNAECRAREYLTEAEVNRLITAAADNRNRHRDATMVLIAYRHGLRAAETIKENPELDRGNARYDREIKNVSSKA